MARTKYKVKGYQPFRLLIFHKFSTLTEHNV
jgi:hypothetical protein